MRLSSVIFFSFNSEIVIFTYGRKLWRGLRGRNLAGVSRFGYLEKGVAEAQNRAALMLRGAAGAGLLPV
jgi:hypothetical protein